MSDRVCEAVRPADGKQCERSEDHAGAHIHGIDTGLLVAWGWALTQETK